MKYIFGTDLTADKNNEKADGLVFLKAELPEPLRKELEKRERALEKAEERAGFPVGLEILRWILLAAWVLCGCGLIKAVGNTTLTQAYRNAPAGFWIGGVSLLLWTVLTLFSKLQEGKGKKGASLLQKRKAFQEVQHSADNWLGIPADAGTMDALLFSYRREEGAEIWEDPALNIELRVYRKEGTLCLTDGNQVFALPLDRLSGLRIIEHSVVLLGWNKEETPSAERFRKAGLFLEQEQPTGLRFCCTLEWTQEGESWQMPFPAYELPVLEALTGLKAPRLPDRRRDTIKHSSPVKHQEKPRSRYYWRFPGKEKLLYWSSTVSDARFKMDHPKLYIPLTCLAIFAFFLPMLGFLFSALSIYHNDTNAWIFLGLFGGMVFGTGLCNLVVAWMDQYLGHWVTILCLVLGGAMMAASWLLLAG